MSPGLRTQIRAGPGAVSPVLERRMKPTQDCEVHLLQTGSGSYTPRPPLPSQGKPRAVLTFLRTEFLLCLCGRVPASNASTVTKAWVKAMMAWVATGSLNRAGEKSLSLEVETSQRGPDGHRLSCSVDVGQGLLIPRLGLGCLRRGLEGRKALD